jgi:hypothetical protein
MSEVFFKWKWNCKNESESPLGHRPEERRSEEEKAQGAKNRYPEGQKAVIDLG